MHFVAVIYILHFVLLSLSSCDFKAVRADFFFGRGSRT